MTCDTSLVVRDRLLRTLTAERDHGQRLRIDPIPHAKRVRRPGSPGVSEREAEVPHLAAEGLADGAIATRLHLCPRTVGNISARCTARSAWPVGRPRSGPAGTDEHRDTCDVANPISPSATVALLRGSDSGVEYLVLGDSFVVLDRADGAPLVVTDPREVTISRSYEAALEGVAMESDEYERILRDLRANRNQLGEA